MPKKKIDSQSNKSQTSLLDLAKIGKEKITVYTKSDKEEEKLIGFNVVLALCSLAFLATGYVYPNNTDLFVKTFALCVFGVFAAIASVPYLVLIEWISDLIDRDLFALKLSVALLICVFNITFLGLFFNNRFFLEIGFLILFIQLIALVIIGFFKIPVKNHVIESEKQGSKLGAIIWTLLDKIAIIGGVISLLLWIYSIIPLILPKS